MYHGLNVSWAKSRWQSSIQSQLVHNLPSPSITIHRSTPRLLFYSLPSLLLNLPTHPTHTQVKKSLRRAVGDVSRFWLYSLFISPLCIFQKCFDSFFLPLAIFTLFIYFLDTKSVSLAPPPPAPHLPICRCLSARPTRGSWRQQHSSLVRGAWSCTRRQHARSSSSTCSRSNISLSFGLHHASTP